MEYKVIIRDPEEGTETYVENLTHVQAREEAEKQAVDQAKKIYVSWSKEDGQEGYLNRDGAEDCPGEPW